MSRRPSSPPTHRITARKWEAHIHISPQTQLKLNSSGPAMYAARETVARNFREASRAKTGGRSFRAGEIIPWEELKIEKLPKSNSTPSTRPVLIQATVSTNGRECDECRECDKGNHERCSQREGCPQAVNYGY